MNSGWAPSLEHTTPVAFYLRLEFNMHMPHGLDTDTHVFFYENEFYVLSNFSAFEVRWMGHVFKTAEHAYQYAKFDVSGGPTVFKRQLIRDTIRMAPSAHEAFRYAREQAEYIRSDWNDRRVEFMLDILRSKADQHEYIRRKLDQTGDKELVENSWRDDFWGWGANRDGQNMLGKLWMKVRAEQRAGQRIRSELAR